MLPHEVMLMSFVHAATKDLVGVPGPGAGVGYVTVHGQRYC